MNCINQLSRWVLIIVFVLMAAGLVNSSRAKKMSSDSILIHVRERSDDEGEPAAPGNEIVLGRSDETYQRHSEGDIVQLADDSLLAVWTRHSNRSDLSESIIIGRRSYNLGMSWGGIETYAALTEAEHRANSNLMDASLLRLQSSDKVLLIYLGKEEVEPESDDDYRKMRCSIYVRSTRDGKNFTKAERISDRDHFYVVNNARVLQLSTGRILVPAAVSLDPGEEFRWMKQSCLTYYSDDEGRSWEQGASCTLLQKDFPDKKYNKLTLQEPGLIELKDGKVFMVMRTKLGHPFKSISSDDGQTWSQPVPIEELETPVSPQTLFRLPDSGHIAIIYNNNPVGERDRNCDRTPLSFAVSTDEGESFKFRKIIQPMLGRTYDYVSVRIYNRNVYLSYREWQIGDYPHLTLADNKLLIIPVEWFEN